MAIHIKIYMGELTQFSSIFTISANNNNQQKTPLTPLSALARAYNIIRMRETVTKHPVLL